MTRTAAMIRGMEDATDPDGGQHIEQNKRRVAIRERLWPLVVQWAEEDGEPSPTALVNRLVLEALKREGRFPPPRQAG